jgi:cell division transport system permease protein
VYARIKYFVRETWVSLRRNTMMTVAGVITVAVSLCVLGGSLLLTRLVDHGTQKWQNGVEFIIFMQPKAPATQTQAVQAQLKDDQDVRSFRYLSHQDAYDDFKRYEGQAQPELVNTITPADLPESFLVAPLKASLTKQVSAQYRNLPGVESIRTAEKAVKDLITTSTWIQRGFLLMFLALLFASLFLIVNTIRLATYARRREIEVMKLVGASNWFVRVPFMLEGMVQGIAGAIGGTLAVFGLQRVLTDAIPVNTDFWKGWYVTSGDAFQISVIVVLLGAGIGALGALVGLRRFLDV